MEDYEEEKFQATLFQQIKNCVKFSFYDQVNKNGTESVELKVNKFIIAYA